MKTSTSIISVVLPFYLRLFTFYITLKICELGLSTIDFQNWKSIEHNENVFSSNSFSILEDWKLSIFDLGLAWLNVVFNFFLNFFFA